MSSTCQKDNCHPFIRIKNLSEIDVINAIKVPGVEGCRLDGKLIAQGDSYDYYPFNSCIEKSLTPNDTLVIYIVDVDGYNDSGVRFDCDSVAEYNTILKQYFLTLDYLKQNNWEVTYP